MGNTWLLLLPLLLLLLLLLLSAAMTFSIAAVIAEASPKASGVSAVSMNPGTVSRCTGAGEEMPPPIVRAGVAVAAVAASAAVAAAAASAATEARGAVAEDAAGTSSTAKRLGKKAA